MWNKCDTRIDMESLLSRTKYVLDKNRIEYWLDKGTLLGIIRDFELIPWEYDVDLGVVEDTCAMIAELKPQFYNLGLIAYDRSDPIEHKVKLTYNTEHSYFYYSDKYIHDPCIRIYDRKDLSIWVDIYWYKRVDARNMNVEEYLVPKEFDFKQDLLCCSEGIRNATDEMCCGGCVPYDYVFPRTFERKQLRDGVADIVPLPAKSEQFLKIQYGDNALQKRQIKGWKGIACAYWVSPWLFLAQIVILIVAIAYMIHIVRRKGYCTLNKKHDHVRLRRKE